MQLIDVHAHVVPEHFPRPPGAGDAPGWPCMCHIDGGAAKVIIDEKLFRTIDQRSWDCEARLADMDAASVDIQVLSPMPELLSYWFEPSVGLEMCRHVNHCIAEMVARYPDRFLGLGIVPLQDPALAARELDALRTAGFRGVEVGSNINGRFLGEAEFTEFYAEAERLRLAVFVHALHPVGADRLQTMPDLVPFAAFPVDTALSAMSLIRAGVPERFPELHFGFSHGGGAIVALTHRLGKGAAVTDNFNGVLSRAPAAYARRFFYDNLVYDPGYAAYLANAFAPGRVFCGTDYPYAIMEATPRGFIDQADLDDPESMCWRAAAEFLRIVSGER